MIHDIKIDNRSTRKTFPLNIEKTISKLLAHCPPEHLLGIQQIVVFDEPGPSKKPWAGRYFRKTNQRQAHIQLALSSIFQTESRLFFYLPLFPKLFLAEVLFHEIGHHYHHVFKHGVGKPEYEDFAEKYSRTMLKKATAVWRYVFLPFYPIVKLFDPIMKKRQRKLEQAG